MLTAGLGGAVRHGCVALGTGQQLVAVCEQERITRVRSAGFNPSGLPDEALDTLLGRCGLERSDVDRFVVAEAADTRAAGYRVERIDHHLAHASSAYLSSPFDSAAIVVCDDELPSISVWHGRQGEVRRVDWPWEGPGFAQLYAGCARVLGFATEGGTQRFEALARLHPGARDDRTTRLFTLRDTAVESDNDWPRTVEEWCVRGGRDSDRIEAKARVAAALQARMCELVVEFLRRVRARVDADSLCLAGTLFEHSSINTAAKCSGAFAHVFVPVNPGNAGLAIGTALHGAPAPAPVSPFLGPAYEGHEIKQTLDNCKLQYAWEPDASVIQHAVSALQQGTLVAWFEGAMEWGPRALGARSILANPFSPYVLENLNRFLKRREPWRGYAISGLSDAVARHFDGPAEAPFMECDYVPRDRAQFRYVLPAPDAAVRVQSVGAQAPPRFRRLLEAFGAATGLPFLVNTSFNGFHEPIVCSPRDAVRVFYGSGIDVLMLEQFVLRK